MEPGKEYSLADFAKMNQVKYYLIQLDDIDGLNESIVSFSSFKKLKKEFLERVDLYPDQDNDPSITFGNLSVSYSANIAYGCNKLVELSIGVRLEKQVEMIKEAFDELNLLSAA